MTMTENPQDTDFEYGLLMVGEIDDRPFPYNLQQIREHLKESGKSLNDVSYNELLPFAIKERINGGSE